MERAGLTLFFSAIVCIYIYVCEHVLVRINALLYMYKYVASLTVIVNKSTMMIIRTKVSMKGYYSIAGLNDRSASITLSFYINPQAAPGGLKNPLIPLAASLTQDSSVLFPSSIHQSSLRYRTIPTIITARSACIYNILHACV